MNRIAFLFSFGRVVGGEGWEERGEKGGGRRDGGG